MVYFGAASMISWELIFWYINLYPKEQCKPNNSLIFLNYINVTNDSSHVFNMHILNARILYTADRILNLTVW